MQTRNSTTVLLHCIFWILLIHLIFDWTGLYYSFIHLAQGKATAIDEAFLFVPFCILLFYWNSNYLIPRFLTKKKWHFYLIGIVVTYFLILLMEVGIVFVLEKQNWFLQNEYDIASFADNALLFNLLAVALSSAWGVSKMAFENAALNKEAKRKQEAAELKFFTAQVNPHFLYNTLNGIYAQALEENAEKTTEMILQLSEIMRYPLNNVAKENVLLTAEIDFIEKFIALQKLRLGEAYPITFTKTGNFNQIKIMPFIFIPIIENAFKYGISQKDKTPVFIHLEMKDKELIFSSRNKKINTKEAKSHLIGIRNLQERLKLKYGDQYSLKIDNSDKDYSIELSVTVIT